MTDSTFSGNGWGPGDHYGAFVSGYAAFSTAGGDATALFNSVTVTSNAGHGLFIGEGGAHAAGDASLIVDRVLATGNGSGPGDGHGIYFGGDGAFALPGSASAVFTDVTTTGNAGHGLFINGDGAYARGGSETATLVMDGIQAGNNGWGPGDGSGVYISGRGAYIISSSGSATTSISDVHIAGVAYHGFFIGSDGAKAGFDAYFSLTDSSFSGNGFGPGDGAGVFINGSAAYSRSSGDSTALFGPLTMTGNAGHGLYVNGNGARSTGGSSDDANLIVDRVLATGNGHGPADGNGIYFNDDGAYASAGSASAAFTAITVTGNAGRGLYINGNGAFASSGGYSASFSVANSQLNSNGGGGLHIAGTGARAIGGDASFSLADSRFTGNGFGTGSGRGYLYQ